MYKLIGLVLLAVGIVLLFVGWQASQGLDDQLTQAFTGRFTDETLWFFVGGVVAVVAGIFMTFIRK